MQLLKECLAIGRGEKLDAKVASSVQVTEMKPARHVYRKITYPEIKVRWAKPESEDELGLTSDHCCFWHVADEDMTRAVINSTLVPFIRPATSQEIADHYEELGFMCVEIGDYAKAGEWYRRAAELGDGSASV